MPGNVETKSTAKLIVDINRNIIQLSFKVVISEFRERNRKKKIKINKSSNRQINEAYLLTVNLKIAHGRSETLGGSL